MKAIKNFLSKQINRIITSVIAGIIVGVIINTIAITFGYIHVQSNGVESHPVNLLGMEIFKIQSINNSLEGIPNPGNMMFIGIIC
ncbi:LlsX family protein [Garciella nitratireducens]|nr:LlsX family protein [Garciella nitratireducens]RBP44101.1 hypothetical protein DFR81_10543 [Garciella nitratireducens]